MKKSFPYIVDSILSLFISFAMCFLLSSLFIRGMNVVYVSICLSLCLSFFYMRFINKNNNPQIKNLQTHLFSLSIAQCYTFFAQVLRTRYKVIRYKNYLLVNDICVCIFIRQENLDLDKMFKFLRLSNKVNSKKTLILCNHISPEVENRSDYKTLTIYDIDKVYDLLKTFNSLPKQEKRKFSLSTIKNQILKKENTRKYLLSSFTLFFFSQIVSFSIFYLLLSIVCFTLSLSCFIKGKIQHKFHQK